MLKELNLAVDRIVTDIGQDTIDKVITEYTGYYLQFGFGKSLRTGKGRFYLREILNRLIRGEASPFSYYADKILDGFDIKTENDEVIGENGAIFIANHSSDGPLRGVWISLALNRVVAQRRNWQGNYENLWLQSAVPETQVYGLTALHRQRIRLARIIENSGCVLTFRAGDIRASFEKASGHLANGGFLGFCPEGTTARHLVRAKWKSARFLKWLTDDWQGPLIPVGFWPEGRTLNMRFGEPIDRERLAGIDDFQKQADRLMVAVAKVLPDERRGVYRKLANKINI